MTGWPLETRTLYDVSSCTPEYQKGWFLWWHCGAMLIFGRLDEFIPSSTRGACTLLRSRHRGDTLNQRIRHPPYSMGRLLVSRPISFLGCTTLRQFRNNWGWHRRNEITQSKIRRSCMHEIENHERNKRGYARQSLWFQQLPHFASLSLLNPNFATLK